MKFQRYLLHSTLIAVFSEAFLFRIGFDLKFMYFIVLINIFLIHVHSGIRFNKGFLAIIAFLFLSGIVSIFVYNNTFANVLFQVFGVFLVAAYFYNFFLKSIYSINYIFEQYCKYAVWLSGIGLALLLILVVTKIDINSLLSQLFPFYGYQSINGPLSSPLKVKSLMLEPAHFGGVILPAFFYILRTRKFNFKIYIITTAVVCTFSLITYLSAIFGFVATQRKINIPKVIALSFLCLGLSFTAYSLIEDVKIRVDDTFEVLSDSDLDFQGINLSTYAIISNMYVTGRVLQSNPVTGHGIGSHPVSHKEYIGGISGTDSFSENGLESINAQDANSLLLRILSENGILGAILVFTFIFKYYSKDSQIISKSILVYFFYKLIRDGHYFSPEMYFFVFSYYFNRTVNTFSAPGHAQKSLYI